MTSRTSMALSAAALVWASGFGTACYTGQQAVKDDKSHQENATVGTGGEDGRDEPHDGGAGRTDDPTTTTTTALDGNPGKPKPANPTAKATYTPPKHPLLVTRSGAPRTSLAVAAEGRLDVGLEIRNEADLSVKRYKDSGASTNETFQLREALQIGMPATTELVQFAKGATLFRVDVAVTVGDAVPLQSLISFMKRLERNAYLTVSEVHFKATKRWWGVCRGGSQLTVSAWYAKGTPSLPETQVHLPKVSATRVAYALVSSMRTGELGVVKVSPRSFSVSGKTKSSDDVAAYVSAVESSHRCIGSVDADGAMADGDASGGSAFVLNGKLKCRTR